MTTKPRTIDAAAYRAARAEGLPPVVAAYAARPAALDLDWLTHYQVDETWADFEHNGRKFRAEIIDPRTTEGECTSCAELVDAYRKQDDGMAWLTPDEYEHTNHAAVTVVILDEDGERGESASLWGVCTLDRTPTERRMAERYMAETVEELAEEAQRAEETARALDVERRAAAVAELRGAYLAALAACA